MDEVKDPFIQALSSILIDDADAGEPKVRQRWTKEKKKRKFSFSSEPPSNRNNCEWLSLLTYRLEEREEESEDGRNVESLIYSSGDDSIFWWLMKKWIERKKNINYKIKLVCVWRMKK